MWLIAVYLSPNPKSRVRLCIKPCATCIPETGRCTHVVLAHLHERLFTTLQRCTLHCFQSKIPLVWKYGMEYGENFSMEWKIFGMEWKKISSMENGKIVFRSIPCLAFRTSLTWSQSAASHAAPKSTNTFIKKCFRTHLQLLCFNVLSQLRSLSTVRESVAFLYSEIFR